MKIYLKIKKFKLIIFILICTIFNYGCESVKTYYVDKENIPKDETVRIVGVFLKSGGYFNLQNKNAKLVLTGKSQGINYDTDSLTKANIRIDDIGVLKIEVAKNNYWMPAAIIAETAAALLIIAIIVQTMKGFSLKK